MVTIAPLVSVIVTGKAADVDDGVDDDAAPHELTAMTMAARPSHRM
jgi:hypothetical protein